jgi:protein-tyrosine phosphatase
MWSIFKKKNEVLPAQPVTVDFHSHFLPGLDDGCATLEESMSLIKQMKEYGYNRLFMSPHVMGDYFKNTPEMILEKLDIVRKEAQLQNINIQLDVTAEYYLDEWFDEKIKSKSLLPFGANNILFEISYVNEPRNLFETIFNLQIAGYQPVLAHPERYSFLHNNFAEYEKLVAQGCRLQINLLSLVGYYGKSEQKTAEKLIEKNMVYYVSSDAHREKHVDLLKKVFATEAFAKVSRQIHNHELLTL